MPGRRIERAPRVRDSSRRNLTGTESCENNVTCSAEMGETVNIRKIAELAECSPSTVSRVLAGRTGTIRISEATKKRIRRVCAELDYQPSIHASRLFSGHSGVIGFLTAGGFMLEDDNLAKSFFHVCSELFRYGCRCLPLMNDKAFLENKDHLTIFKRNEIDGLLIWGAGEHDTFLEELRRAGYPFLLITNRVEGYPSVYSEQRTAVRKLTDDCIRLGAKRLAGLMSSDGFSYRQRKEGFLEAAESSPCEAKLFSLSTGPGNVLENAYRAAAEILSWSPDAVICANDEAAVGIEKYCIEHEVRIPDDLLLTGGDNIKLSEYCQIPLTTFDQMAAECAACAVELLMDHLKHGTPLQSAERNVRILRRRSTERISGSSHGE